MVTSVLDRVLRRAVPSGRHLKYDHIKSLRLRHWAEGGVMPFKSQAQRRKFAELLLKGEISNQTFEEWNRETGAAKLPERVKPKARKKSKSKAKAKRKSKPKGKRKRAKR